MKEKLEVLGIVILALCSICVSGVMGFVEVDAPTISLDANGTGAANASVCVANHSRLVYVWCDLNASNDTRIMLGKDGAYVEFGRGDEKEYLVMGISPRWNQTVELYVTNASASFDIWGTVVAGSVWRNNGWEIDNPAQPDCDVILATITEEKKEKIKEN